MEDIKDEVDRLFNEYNDHQKSPTGSDGKKLITMAERTASSSPDVFSGRRLKTAGPRSTSPKATPNLSVEISARQPERPRTTGGSAAYLTKSQR